MEYSTTSLFLNNSHKFCIVNMKKLFSFLSVLFSVFCLYSQILTIGNITYQVDTVANFQVGPGTQYIAIRLTTTTPGANQNVFFLKTDLRNEHIEIRQVLSRDSLIGNEITSREAGRRTTPEAFYFAGINADFFSGSTPIGGNMAESEIGRIPNDDRAVFAIDENGMPDAGFMSYKGSLTFGGNTHSITSVNLTRGTNALVLYNQLNGRFTRTNEHGTEVLVELLPNYAWGVNRTLRAKVLEIEKNRGSMRIPAGKAVLSGHGTSRDILNELNIGDEVEVDFELVMNDNTWHWAQMTGGGCEGFCRLMLDNGVVETDYPATVWFGRNPRTGIGFTASRDTLIMAVVEGRNGNISTGVTLPHFAEIMKSAGAWTAVNLDGGGSSTFFVEPFGITNRPSDGVPRPVTNHVFVVSTAPEDNNISAIVSHTPALELPVHGEFIPQFFGYNQYGVLIDPNLQGVVLSAPPSLGTIVGNKFIAGGNNASGVITATYNGAVTEIRVNFIPVLDIVFRLDTVVLDNRTDYLIEVMATTARGALPISPLALTWTVENPEICEVVVGKIRALSNGTTIVTGQIDGITRHMVARVEIPLSPVILVENTEYSNWTMAVAAQYRADAQLNEENLPAHWEHGIAVNFIHRTGAGPSIRLTNQTPLFGLPDTIRIVMNAGEIAINSVNVSLRANNSNRLVPSRTTSFPTNQDFSIDLVLDALFDMSDHGIFPIWFDNINFTLIASGMTAGRAYTLAIKEIQLIYAGLLQTNIPFVGASPASFFIFPNPAANGVLHLQLRENTSQTVRTEIYNLQGKMLSREVHGIYNGFPLSLSIQHLSAGAYFLQVFENEKNSGAMKFIVK